MSTETAAEARVYVAIRIRPHNKRELADWAQHGAFASSGGASPLSVSSPFAISPSASFAAAAGPGVVVDGTMTPPAIDSSSSSSTDPSMVPPSVICLDSDTNTIHLLEPERDWYEREAFTFDKVFWSVPPSQTKPPPGPCDTLFSPPARPHTQEDVFNEVGLPSVASVVKGLNTCIFAYGQTGAGKSHSMLGSHSDPGIAPRFVNELFRELDSRARHVEDSGDEVEKCEVKVELGFLEIYNEKVRDLLLVAGKSAAAAAAASSSSSGLGSGGGGGGKVTDESYSNCRVRHHPEKGTFVEGLQRKLLANAEECLAAIDAGMNQRATAATSMNDTSSRSHGIFQLVVTQRFPNKGTTRTSLVNLVDLAGSERIKQSGVVGTGLQEAVSINKSLSALRRVIDVLIDNGNLPKGKKPAVPPYRESLLTWVLSDSLGGNSRTVMVAAASPNAICFEDTLSTLRYALKAKAIVCNAKVNEEKSAAIMTSLKSEMAQLREQLDATASRSVEKELADKQAAISEMEKKAQRYEQNRASTEDELVRRQAEIAAAQEKLKLLESVDATEGAVEEQKARMEEDLLRMRERQAADEEQLRREAEQREKAESELQAATEQRRSVELTAERQERELSAAIQEEEQMRVRQLLATLQAAFVRFIAGQNLTQLRKEREQLAVKLERSKKVNDRTSHRHHELKRQKAHWDGQLEFLQKKVDKVLHHELLSSSLNALRDRRVLQLRKQQQAANDNIERALQDLDVARLALEKVKQERQLRYNDFLVEKAKLETRIAELDRQSGHAESRIDHHFSMVQEFEESEAQWRSKEKHLLEGLAKMNDGNDHRSQNIAALREALSREGTACAGLVQKVHVKEAEYSALNEQLCGVIAAVEEAQRRNAELRQQMDGVFLPPTPRTTQAFFRSGTNATTSAMSSSSAGGGADEMKRASTPRAGSSSVAAAPFSRTTTRFSSVASSTAAGAGSLRYKEQRQLGDVRSGGVHYNPPLSMKRRTPTPSSSSRARTSKSPRRTTGSGGLLHLPAASSSSSAAGGGGISPMSLSRNNTAASCVSASSLGESAVSLPENLQQLKTPPRNNGAAAGAGAGVPSLQLGRLREGAGEPDVAAVESTPENNRNEATPENRMLSAINNNNNNSSAVSMVSPLSFTASDSYNLSPSPGQMFSTPCGGDSRRAASSTPGRSGGGGVRRHLTGIGAAAATPHPKTGGGGGGGVASPSEGKGHVRPRLAGRSTQRAFR